MGIYNYFNLTYQDLDSICIQSKMGLKSVPLKPTSLYIKNSMQQNSTIARGPEIDIAHTVTSIVSFLHYATEKSEESVLVQV